MNDAVLRDAPEQPAALVTEALRRSLRRVAATVTVIALKGDDGAFFATTATAFVPVCFEPPTILVCLNRASAIGGPITREALFSIGILDAGQASVAGLCAGGAPHHEREDLFHRSPRFAGVPVLRGAQASLICRRADIAVRGTHIAVFGDVIDASCRSDVDPLLYLDGRYGRFHAGHANQDHR